jgi:hypothetical protein
MGRIGGKPRRVEVVPRTPAAFSETGCSCAVTAADNAEGSGMTAGVCDIEGPPARWLNEQEVAELSGLPGPLVEDDLLPRLPTPPDIAYHRGAQVYTAESVVKARIAAYMLAFGIRYRYISAGMREPLSDTQLERVLGIWRHIHHSPAAGNRAGRIAPDGAARWPAGVLRSIVVVLQGPFRLGRRRFRVQCAAQTDAYLCAMLRRTTIR